jgi:4-hydroxy-tetrahydrodipicolinate synthase
MKPEGNGARGIAGVYCAALTPLDAHLEPDLAELGAHCRRLLASGCDGVALLGTTGEASSFSALERRNILESMLIAGIPPDKLLPGVGVPSVSETVDLARHALSLGIHNLLILPPYYYKDITDEGLLDFYSRVLDRVGNPRMRVLLYHIPQITHVALSPWLIGRLRGRFGEVVAGMKDSSGDLAHMLRMLEEFPDLAVFAGADPLLRPLLEAGGAGCITATCNVVAADLVTIARNHAQGIPEGRTDAAVEAVRAVFARSQIPGLKAAMARLLRRPSWRATRPPLVALTEHEAAAVLAKLSSVPDAPVCGGADVPLGAAGLLYAARSAKEAKCR